MTSHSTINTLYFTISSNNINHVTPHSKTRFRSASMQETLTSDVFFNTPSVLYFVVPGGCLLSLFWSTSGRMFSGQAASYWSLSCLDIDQPQNKWLFFLLCSTAVLYIPRTMSGLETENTLTKTPCVLGHQNAVLLFSLSSV